MSEEPRIWDSDPYESECDFWLVKGEGSPRTLVGKVELVEHLNALEARAALVDELVAALEVATPEHCPDCFASEQYVETEHIYAIQHFKGCKIGTALDHVRELGVTPANGKPYNKRMSELAN